MSTPNKLKRVYDINPSGGGPVFKDRLWFYGSLRFQESSVFQAGAFANKNGGDLSKWTYEPDLSKPGEGRLTVIPSGSVRLTWQATPRNKIAFSAEPQNRHWINGLSALFSPEIYPDWQFNHESLTTGTWTAPVTSRLLLEARYANHAEGFVDKYPEPDDPYRRAIPVREATTGFLYRGKGYCCLPVFFGTQNAPFTQQASASMSYITGSHALKVGFQNDFGTLTQEQFDNEQGLFYTFNNGVPTSIQQHALPFAQKTHLSLDMGIYAQDRWTFKRATINAGVRVDLFKNKFPEQTLGPASFVPNRNIVIPETPYASLKDITPRIGVAYDLFGNGRTSLRSSWGKYMIGLSPLAGNPVSLLAYVANRSWTPSLPQGHPNYYIPQCDLNSTLANGDCGALDNALFGQLRPSAAIDPNTISGWGNRAWNQEFSTSVQQQILPRVAVDFGYFRRWYGNFQVVDNRAVGPADYTRYSITVPTDPRLPDSGQTLSGLYELVPGKVGQVDNYTTFADDYGKQIEHWNGFDFTINARPSAGVNLQGGWSTGRTSDRQLRPASEAAGDYDPSRWRCPSSGPASHDWHHRGPRQPVSRRHEVPQPVQVPRNLPRAEDRRAVRGHLPGDAGARDQRELRRDAGPDQPVDAALGRTASGERPGTWHGVRGAHPAARHPLLEDPALRPDEIAAEPRPGQRAQRQLLAGHHAGLRRAVALSGEHHGRSAGQTGRPVRLLAGFRLPASGRKRRGGRARPTRRERALRGPLASVTGP